MSESSLIFRRAHAEYDSYYWSADTPPILKPQDVHCVMVGEGGALNFRF